MPRTLLVLLLAATPAAALDPAAVAVVANKNDGASVAVAEHYLKVRAVPRDNLVLLDLPAGDDIARADYDTRLAGPLRAVLEPRKDKIKVVLTVFGVPLRVGPQVPTADEKRARAAFEPRMQAARKEVEAAGADPAKRRAAQKELDELYLQAIKLDHNESQAAVDSELMLLWFPPYPTERFVPNPLHWQYPAAKKALADRTLMTARLDGPTADIARRLVDDAVAVEQSGGLKGRAYIDARGIGFDPKKPGEAGTGYEGYDESFREAALALTAAGLNVTLDDKPELFAANACPDAALYAGWYALADYRPSLTLNRGSVAWHLASSEAASLRAGNKFWCPNLLAAGAAVTIGPVAEPYTVGFPKPAEFFTLLATGEHTVVECYAKTAYLASWMGILVGDPLYNPYAAAKPGKGAKLTGSPRGLPSVFR